MTTTAIPIDDAHARKMGPVLASFLVAGNMIGSGVFLLPVTLAAIGSMTVIGWVIASVGALILGAVYAYLSRLRPNAHGLVSQVTEALGRFLGFEAGFAYWLSCVCGNLAIALAVIGYLAFFFPLLKEPIWTTSGVVAAMWLLTFANILGPKFIGRLHGASLAVGLLPIIAATVLGFLFFDPAMFQASWNVSGKAEVPAISSSIVPIFWAFLGLESASVCARAVRDPGRNVPLATFGGIGLAAVVYIAAGAAVFGALPATTLATSTAPFADVVAKFLGGAIGGLIAACAVIKASGTLGGWVMVAAQTTQAGVEEGYLPRVLSQPHPHGVPVRELIILGVLMTLIAYATMQPTLAKQFGVLINVAANLSLAVYALCSLALFRFAGELAKGANLARGIAALGVAFSVWAIVSGDLEMLKVQGWILVASLPIWALIWWTGRPKSAPQPAE
jgi:arginine:agmatine antiporter